MRRSAEWFICFTRGEVHHELSCLLPKQPTYEDAVCVIAYAAPANTYVYPDATEEATGLDRALAFFKTNGISDLVIERQDEFHAADV